MERIYLLLNKEGVALAQAVLESPRITEVVQLRLTKETDLDFVQLGEHGRQGVVLVDGHAALRGHLHDLFRHIAHTGGYDHRRAGAAVVAEGHGSSRRAGPFMR